MHLVNVNSQIATIDFTFSIKASKGARTINWLEIQELLVDKNTRTSFTFKSKRHVYYWVLNYFSPEGDLSTAEGSVVADAEDLCLGVGLREALLLDLDDLVADHGHSRVLRPHVVQHQVSKFKYNKSVSFVNAERIFFW